MIKKLIRLEKKGKGTFVLAMKRGKEVECDGTDLENDKEIDQIGEER